MRAESAAGGRGELTSPRRIETRLLAKEGLEFDCIRESVSSLIGFASMNTRDAPQLPSSMSFGARGTFEVRRVRCDAGNRPHVRFARKKPPEMFRSSQRTTTIFWPLSSCLATMLASRPRRWPLPSMTICRAAATRSRQYKVHAASGVTYDRLEGGHGGERSGAKEMDCVVVGEEIGLDLVGRVSRCHD